jgi:regulator of sigma E protease
MFSLLLSILIFIVTIIVLVMVHEWGHYWVARCCGIKVLRVSIGFGKPLWIWRAQNGTEYVIAAIPLGGYVRLLDEREGPVAAHEQEEAFNRQTMLKRAAVIFAGPLANFLLAILLYWIVLGVGITHVRPVVGYTIPGSIAAQAGLPSGAELKVVDNQPITSWSSVGMAFISHLGEKAPVLLQAEKSNQTHDYRMDLSKWKLDPLQSDWLTSIGIEPAVPPETLIVQQVSPYKGAAWAGVKPGDTLLTIQNEPITDRMMLLRALKPYAGQTIRLTFEREGRRLHAMTQIGQCASFRGVFEGYLGLTFAPIQWPPSALYTEQAPLFEAAYIAVQKVWRITVFNTTVLYKLVVGDLSIQGLSGPLGIFAGSVVAMQQGFIHYLSFLALLSVGLGIINLFPIPGLDGSRLVYLLIERGRGRPLSIATEALIFRLGFIILLVLMIQISIGDILRFIQMGWC